ncbi:MAG: hypothetical protein CR974_00130 [Gammaproteobacteria bacterium]|nr:MAG: hypothetical protein CR974_00130 [Gammaproteobacteria bacterium]
MKQTTLTRFIALALLSASFSSTSAFAQTLSAEHLAELREQPLVKIAPQNQAIELQNAAIESTLTGRTLHSKITLTVHNPNARQLEGELILPLPDGMTISGFALDINGEMRPAVPVEKAKGRQVFEDTIRQQIDPALLEKTVGNTYRLRIYPLPANGERTVELNLQQTLASDDGALISTMPMTWLAKAQKVSHKLSVMGWQDKQLNIGADGKTAVAKDHDGVLVYDLAKAREQVNIRIEHVKSRQLLVTKQAFENELYLYGEIPVATLLKGIDDKQQNAVPSVKKLSVIWDASLSGKSRDLAREIQLLLNYVQSLKNIEVELIVVRNDQKKFGFSIQNGDVSALRKRLDNIAYDGASHFADWQIATDSDAVLVFTDGMETLKSQTKSQAKNLSPFATDSLSKTAPKIVKFITSTPNANARLLAQWAQNSGGEWVNITTLNDDVAERKIATQHITVTGLSSPALADINLAPVDLQREDVLVFTAKATDEALACYKSACDGKQFDLNVQLRDADGQVIDKKLTIDNSALQDDDNAPRQWADMRIATLSADADSNKEEILALGKQYRRVTDFTSLIVLDNLNDYVRHEIEPPADMKKAYAQQVARIQRQKKDQTQRHLNDLVARQKQLIAWWEKDYPKDMPILKKIKNRFAGSASVIAENTEVAADMAPMPAPAHAPSRRNRSQNEPVQVLGDIPVVGRALRKSSAPKRKVATSQAMPTTARIKLKAWSSDQSYIQAVKQFFEKSGTEAAYREYLAQRQDYLSSPSFYVDMAEFFYQHNTDEMIDAESFHQYHSDEIATRILTNLAEISNDDRQLLRVLAYRLSQAKHHKAAIAVLEKVTKLAPEEPQSWRDLGLAYADDGQWQKAVDNLWKVVSKAWDGRFSDIDLIALNEFNHIVHTQAVNTEAFDARLIKSMPVGMRVVLSWDTDNSDMDLWVTDPNGEKVFYEHPNSYQGGRLSRDFTGGYGPESFMLKAPKAGKYKVEANFYGTQSQKVSTQTTLQLRFYKNFGRSSVEEKRVMLRLEPKSQQVFVGEFEVE